MDNFLYDRRSLIDHWIMLPHFLHLILNLGLNPVDDCVRAAAGSGCCCSIGLLLRTLFRLIFLTPIILGSLFLSRSFICLGLALALLFFLTFARVLLGLALPVFFGLEVAFCLLLFALGFLSKFLLGLVFLFLLLLFRSLLRFLLLLSLGSLSFGFILLPFLLGGILFLSLLLHLRRLLNSIGNFLFLLLLSRLVVVMPSQLLLQLSVLPLLVFLLLLHLLLPPLGVKPLELLGVELRPGLLSVTLPTERKVLLVEFPFLLLVRTGDIFAGVAALSRLTGAEAVATFRSYL
mmetsp:Transcript_21462/g.47917  ORF Transcript_21462/g.47917 Transcript_21462/m.47917 type:complete len:291 (+) Transcript_21462:182-1054(+)